MPLREINIHLAHSAEDAERVLSLNCNAYTNIEQISWGKKFEGTVSNRKFKIALPNFASSGWVQAISSLAVIEGEILQVENGAHIKALCRPQIPVSLIAASSLLFLVITPFARLIANGENGSWAMTAFGISVIGIIAVLYFKEVKRPNAVLCHLLVSKETR